VTSSLKKSLNSLVADSETLNKNGVDSLFTICPSAISPKLTTFTISLMEDLRFSTVILASSCGLEANSKLVKSPVIMRVADWYGVQHIVCSLDTADWQNPKVISASKGSFTRVAVHYTNLVEYLADLPAHITIAGALLEGENIHKTELSLPTIVVMGNESVGISEQLMPLIKKKLTIPSFGKAESLNVGIATAIMCDAFRRS